MLKLKVLKESRPPLNDYSTHENVGPTALTFNADSRFLN